MPMREGAKRRMESRGNVRDYRGFRLRLLKMPLGLLVHFGAWSFKEGIRRIVNQHHAFARAFVVNLFSAGRSIPPQFRHSGAQTPFTILS